MNMIMIENVKLRKKNNIVTHKRMTICNSLKVSYEWKAIEKCMTIRNEVIRRMTIWRRMIDRRKEVRMSFIREW